MGPVLSYATVNVHFDLDLYGVTYPVNKFNCVGLWTLGLFILSFVFICRSIDASARPDDSIVEPLSLKLFRPRLIMIFTLALFVNMGVSAWETVVTPLAQQHFRWGVQSNSLIFILSGAILFFSNIVLVRIATSYNISDALGTVVSVAVATVGAVLLLVGGNKIGYFVVGNLLFTLGKRISFGGGRGGGSCQLCMLVFGICSRAHSFVLFSVCCFFLFLFFISIFYFDRYILSSYFCHFNVY